MDIQLTLERGLFDLLARIAEDYGLDYEDMCERYMSAPAPKKRSSSKPPRTSSPPKVCQGKTAKGQPCKKKACAGGDFCKTHEPKEATDEALSSDAEEAPPKLCQGKTAKGQGCKKKACAGSDFCKTHEPLLSEGEEEEESTGPKLCKGVTGKKKPCKKKACSGGDYCAAHTGEGPFKLPASSSIKAAIHTHEPGETSEECDACSQYGDPVNSPEARREYRIVTRSISKKVVEEEEDDEDMTEFAENLQKELEAQGLLEEED